MKLTRREWLATTAIATTLPAQADPPKPIVIDTHTHFYDPSRPEGVPWPNKDSKKLYRTVLPKEYRKLAEPLGITGTVVVEASSRVEDNQWLLDLAKDEPFIVGIVGRLDPADAEFRKHLDRFAKNPLFRGIRISHDQVKKALAEASIFRNLTALSERSLTLDVNGGQDLLVDVAKLAGKLPKLRIVVNHMANPKIDGQAPDASYRVNLKAAAQPNVWCKLSALVEGTRKTDAAPKDLAFYRPVVEAVWTAFGAKRLVFGSNWPVSDQYAPLTTVHKLASEFIKDKKATAIWGTNAIEAYQITRVPSQ